MNITKLRTVENARSVSSEIQQKINSQLIKIISNCLKKPNTAERKIIAQFANSLLNKKSKEIAKKTLQMLLNQIDCISNTNQLITFIGKNAYKNTFSVLNVTSRPEEENSQHLRLSFSTVQTGLPNIEYYKSQKPHNRKIYKYYKFMLKMVGNIFHFDNIDHFAEMEQKYIDIIDNSQDEKTVTKTGKQLEDNYKHINWELFWNQFKIQPSEWKNQKFVIYSQKWLEHVNSMFAHLSMSDWRTYLRALMILNYINFLPSEITKYSFHLYNYLLNGQQKPSNNIVFVLSTIKSYLEIPLSIVYVKETHHNNFRDKIKKFVQNIQNATIERIDQIDWLEDKTKIVAAKKVKNINLGILYMTQSYNYKIPKLTNNIISNTQIIGQSLTEKELEDVKKKYTTDIWDDVPVYNVNAYYSSAGNRLFIPSAIANWPFYCEHASIGWNYGSLGCVIGHEITHAFDDNGKDYDENGNRANWWTATDKRKYKEKIDSIIDLYKHTKIYGQNIDANDTLSENIADLGGVGSALQALKNELNANNANDQERIKEYRNFFIGYATSWREKERRTYGLRELITDVHSPAIVRVNNIVRHFEEWYDVFDICTSDPLYITVDKRIHIF